MLSLLGPNRVISTQFSKPLVYILQAKGFDNWVLSKIYGPNREEVTEKWKKYCITDGLHDLHSTYII